jgi:aminoglycoside phosphotransferase (APT) family kinase protein
MLAEFVEGVFEKSGTIPSANSNEQRSQMYVSLIDTLAKIHAVDIDKVGLDSYGKRRDPTADVRETGYIARQIKVNMVYISLIFVASHLAFHYF